MISVLQGSQATTMGHLRFAFRTLAVLALVCGVSRMGSAQALQPGGPTDFGTLAIGASNQVTLTFSASVVTTISSVVTTTDGAQGQDFTVASQNCTGVQAPPSSCSITMQFSPKQIGLRKGALSITDGTGAVVNRVFLHGIGTGPQLSFGPLGSSVQGAQSAAEVLDGAGNLFYDDIASGTIRERDTNGNVTTLATVPGSGLSGMAISGAGTLYISVPSLGQVLSLVPGGVPQVLATGSVVLVSPSGLAVDGLGYLYIADNGAGKIIRVALDGSGTTALTFTGLATPLAAPTGLAIDAANNLYIVDSVNNRVVKGGLFTGAATVMPINGLSLLNPRGVALDGAGSLYIADTGNGRYVFVDPTGAASVLPVPGATLSAPSAVIVTGKGDLLLADAGLGVVSLVRSSMNLVFPTATKVGELDATDGTLSFTVTNTGNYTLKLTKPTTGTNPALDSKAFLTAVGGATCPQLNVASPASSPATFAQGVSCSHVAQFSPTNTGSNVGHLTLSAVDAAGSSVALTTVATLSGIGVSSLTGFTIVATPTVTGLNQPVNYTITALAGTVPAADYLGTVTLTSTDATAVFGSSASYTFTAADAGVHTFSGNGGVRFRQVGVFTISVADNAINGTSNTVTVLATPTVTIGSTVNPIFIQNPTTLSATVSQPGTAAPTGTVTFYDGTTVLGQATVTNGAATLPNVAFTTAAFHGITAQYSGDTNYASSTSVSLTQQVGDFTWDVLSGTSNTATATYGQPATFQLQVAPLVIGSNASNIVFSVSGLPSGVTASFSPSTAGTGTNIVPVTLKLTVTAAQGHATLAARMEKLSPVAFALLALPLTLWRKRRRVGSLLLVLLLAGSALGLTGCLSDSASGYYGHTPSTNILTVTATSGNLSHSTTVTLTVQ